MRKMSKRQFVLRSIFIWITASAFILAGSLAWASSHGPQMEAAKKWVENEFQPSTLSKDEQMKEMEWFRIPPRYSSP